MGGGLSTPLPGESNTESLERQVRSAVEDILNREVLGMTRRDADNEAMETNEAGSSSCGARQWSRSYSTGCEDMPPNRTLLSAANFKSEEGPVPKYKASKSFYSTKRTGSVRDLAKSFRLQKKPTWLDLFQSNKSYTPSSSIASFVDSGDATPVAGTKTPMASNAPVNKPSKSSGDFSSSLAMNLAMHATDTTDGVFMTPTKQPLGTLATPSGARVLATENELRASTANQIPLKSKQESERCLDESIYTKSLNGPSKNDDDDDIESPGSGGPKIATSLASFSSMTDVSPPHLRPPTLIIEPQPRTIPDGRSAVAPKLNLSLRVDIGDSDRSRNGDAPINFINPGARDLDLLDDMLDDEGVVRVDDDDDLEGSLVEPDTPKRNRMQLLKVSVSSSNLEESMMFTRSGAINLADVKLPIRDTGMADPGDALRKGEQGQGRLGSENIQEESRLDSGTGGGRGGGARLKDRVVRLERLGQGAAGTVYKAFDLATLSLVALKEIPIFDRNKRRQMVHELNSLYQNLVDANHQRDTLRREKARQHEAKKRERRLQRARLKEEEENRQIQKQSERQQMDKSRHESNINDSEFEEEKREESKSCAKGNDGTSGGEILKTTGNDAAALAAAEENVEGMRNVVGFIDAFSNVEGATVSLMVEFMNGGSLQNIVDSGGCDDESTLASIGRQSVVGLRFLHRSAHVHRDIKPANMLINYAGDVKISDFGIIRKLEVKDSSSSKRRSSTSRNEYDDNGGTMNDPGMSSQLIGPSLKSAQTFVGTVTYMSPERINGEAYSTPSDIWSLGLSLMTCALGRLPLRTDNGFWGLLQCVRDDPSPSLPNDGRWSDEFQNFIACCLKKKPSERWTCDMLLKHPWLGNDSSVSTGATARSASVSLSRGMEEKRAEVEETEGRRDDDEDDAKEVEAFLTARAESELAALLVAVKEHITAMVERGGHTEGLAPINTKAAQASTPEEVMRHLFAPTATKSTSPLRSGSEMRSPSSLSDGAAVQYPLIGDGESTGSIALLDGVPMTTTALPTTNSSESLEGSMASSSPYTRFGSLESNDSSMVPLPVEVNPLDLLAEQIGLTIEIVRARVDQIINTKSTSGDKEGDSRKNSNIVPESSIASKPPLLVECRTLSSVMSPVL